MKKHFSATTLGSIFSVAGALMLAGCATVNTEPVKVEIPVFPSPPDEPRFFYERTLYSSADVVKEDGNAAMRRALTGESRSGEFLGKPYGVAVFHGRVYVTDTVNRNVAVFDIPGQRFFKIGEGDAGTLAMPIGLDVDGNGNVYVVDNKAKLVQVYDTDGKHLRSIGGPKWFAKPSAWTRKNIIACVRSTRRLVLTCWT
jgi:DNA-binding beta-propeller fold protein YncE